MKMSEEMALRLHRMMWSDMRRELGDNPSGEDRIEYKMKWIGKHFPGEPIDNNCWLCEFTHTPCSGAQQCKNCPIKWPHDSCTDISMHYQSAPISEILALPARNGYLARLDDKKIVVDSCSYYKFREDQLSKASGIPATSAIADHVKAIKEKAVQQSDFSIMYCNAKKELAEASGLPEADTITDHIAQIRKKEDRSVMQVLKNFSGLKGEGCWVIDHVKAIQEKAVEEYFANTPGAKLATMDVDEAFKQYADEQKAPIFRALAEASGLSAGNESVKAHIREIVKNSMEAGATEERDRIQSKIEELLS